MAAYYNTSTQQELDDVHRLLPREILEDIGIVDPAEQQLLDVVEDLAARLAVVLGGNNNPNIASSRRPQANAARGLGGTGVVLAGRGNNVRRAVPAPSLNSLAPPPVPGWHAMAGVRNDMVFAPVMPPIGAGAQPTTTAPAPAFSCRGLRAVVLAARPGQRRHGHRATVRALVSSIPVDSSRWPRWQ